MYNKLGEIVQEQSPKKLERFLGKYCQKYNLNLNSFLSTAVCEPTLRQKAAEGYSAVETLALLHEYGADLRHENHVPFRTLLYQPPSEPKVYREAYKCIEFYLVNNQL
eukprot:UN33753